MKPSALAGNRTRRLARGLVPLGYPMIEVSHRERSPASGPVLFMSNHPNSRLDPPVIGWAAPRPVHFLAIKGHAGRPRTICCLKSETLLVLDVYVLVSNSHRCFTSSDILHVG
jgi:hypothetical protein